MLSPELMKRIKMIELRTNRLVQNVFAGAYQSVYKGRGMSFASVRPYMPGDDVRVIDWKVTARYGEPYIKEFIEERELTLVLVIDGSASVLFGTQDKRKRDFGAEFGAVLALAANKNNDRSGLLIFSDEIEHYVPPKKGRSHILRIIRDLLTHETRGVGTDMGMALRTINRVLDSGAIVFIISDYLLDPASYERELIVTSQQHDAVAVVLTDPLEEAIPDVGLMRLKDAETGAEQWVDTSSAEWQAQFKRQREAMIAQRDQTLARARIDRLDLQTGSDYTQKLMQFFQQRMGRR
jgi:uncharacterized protein (DUF58 family)